MSGGGLRWRSKCTREASLLAGQAARAGSAGVPASASPLPAAEPPDEPPIRLAVLLLPDLVALRRAPTVAQLSPKRSPTSCDSRRSEGPRAPQPRLRRPRASRAASAPPGTPSQLARFAPSRPAAAPRALLPRPPH